MPRKVQRKPIGVRIDPELAEQLRQVAKLEERTLGQTIERAFKLYIDQFEETRAAATSPPRNDAP